MKVGGIFIGFLLRSKGFPDNAMETLKQKLKRGSAAPGTESVTMTDVYLRADLEAGHQYNNNRDEVRDSGRGSYRDLGDEEAEVRREDRVYSD